MIPGELIAAAGDIELNAGRRTLVVDVTNRGDRPVQVGSHYHFAETNDALDFDRAAALGMRLNIAAGTAVRFEPGQSRSVELVDYAGRRAVFGFNAKVMRVLGAPTGGSVKAAGAKPGSGKAPAKKAASGAVAGKAATKVARSGKPAPKVAPAKSPAKRSQKR